MIPTQTVGGTKTQTQTTSPASTGDSGKYNLQSSSGGSDKSSISIPTLPSSVTKLLDTKLASFSSDTDRRIWLAGVQQKITNLLSNVANKTTRGVLYALSNLVKQKIDSMSETSTDSSSLINSLFK